MFMFMWTFSSLMIPVSLSGPVSSTVVTVMPWNTLRHSLIQNFLVMCAMVPRGRIEVSCLSRVAMGPASSFPFGTQTSRASPGSSVLVKHPMTLRHPLRRHRPLPPTASPEPVRTPSISRIPPRRQRLSLEGTKGVPSNGGHKWQLVWSCFTLNSLHAQTLTLTDVQTPSFGPP